MPTAAATTAVNLFVEVSNSGNSALAEEPRIIHQMRAADRREQAAQGVAVPFRLFGRPGLLDGTPDEIAMAM